MVVAVNTRILIKGGLEGLGYFIREVFQILVKKYPEHQFYFLFDRPFAPEYIFGENVHGIVINPPARHPILWKYWFDLRVPAVLKKIKADVFVSPDGFCSLSTRVPQCLVVHDLGFLHFPDVYKKSHALFYRTFTPKYVRKAKTIATVSTFSKNDVVRHYHTDPDKIRVVYSAVKDIFQPVSEQEKDEIKARFTEGKEYFIYVGALQPRKNLVNLLKAFSIFKKRQQSGMKLVFAGRLAWKNNAFLDQLRTYKYRSDIVLTEYVDENTLVKLIGGSYALVYPSLFEGFGVPVLEAMKCHVPALTSKGSSMEEIAASAGLYFDPSDHQDIAEKMMQIYKDEKLRRELIEEGRFIAAGYSWEKTAELLWASIEEAAAQS
jgi:glycosyltransferase involved in cell wall biosynthesis